MAKIQNNGPAICQIKQEPNTQTEAGLQKIIDICQKHLQEQTESVQGIVNLFSQLSGYELVCHQIGTFCNRIILEAFNNGQTIVNLCKSFTNLSMSSKSSTLSSFELIRFVDTVSPSDCGTYVSNSSVERSHINSIQATPEDAQHQVATNQSPASHPLQDLVTVTKKNDDVDIDTHEDQQVDQSRNFEKDQSVDLADDQSNQSIGDHANSFEDDIPNSFTGDQLSDSHSEDLGKEPDPNDQEWSLPKSLLKPKKVFTCSVCSKSFTSETFFRKHQRSHEASFVPRPLKEKLYHCTFCAKSFSRKNVLKRHKKIKHLDEIEEWEEEEMKKKRRPTPEELTCEFCGKLHNWISELKLHRYIHTGERPFICEVCGGSFKYPGNLRAHKFTHTKTKPFECQLCDYTGVSNQHLKKHMVVHSSEKKSLQCEECGTLFVTRSSLRNHKNLHLGIKPYSCDLCGKKFTAKHKMQFHRKTHTEEMKYSCDICGKRSHQPYNIVVHMRTHTGHKPYSCTLCGKKFAHNVSLRQHKRLCSSTSHNDEITEENQDQSPQQTSDINNETNYSLKMKNEFKL